MEDLKKMTVNCKHNILKLAVKNNSPTSAIIAETKDENLSVKSKNFDNADSIKKLGAGMNKTISGYIKTCNDNELYRLFDLIIEEMNKRKEKERKEQAWQNIKSKI